MTECHTGMGWEAEEAGGSLLVLQDCFWNSISPCTTHHHTSPSTIIITSSFARFACSAASPSFTYVSNLVPDSSLRRAAAPRLCPLQLLLAACVRFSCCSTIASTSVAAPRLCPLQLLLPDCVCFNCCSPFASTSSCCTPIASASAAARRLRPLQLLLSIASALAAAPRLRPLQLLLPDCVRFNCCSPDCVRFDCCSPIVCIRLQPQLDSSPCPHPGPMFSNIVRGVRGSVN